LRINVCPAAVSAYVFVRGGSTEPPSAPSPHRGGTVKSRTLMWITGALFAALAVPLRPAILATLVCVLSVTSFASGPIYGPFTAKEVGHYTPVYGYSYHVLSPTGSYTRSFEGMDANTQPTFDLDPNGAVGKKQYLQWVNSRLQPFDKTTGGKIWCLTSSCTIPEDSDWSNNFWYGNQSGPIKECAAGSYAEGDGVVIYDRVDSVWVVMHRVYVNNSGVTNYYMCVAVSSGDDLSSTSTVWHMYEYPLDSVLPRDKNNNYFFPDYPKISSWANGHFVLEFDMEDASNHYGIAGFMTCLLDKTNMLAGNTTTAMKCEQFSPSYSYPSSSYTHPSLIHTALPADVDGATPPSRGSSAYFLATVNPGNLTTGVPCTVMPCTSTRLAFFKMSPSGVLTGPTYITSRPFTPGCYQTKNPASTICVPEPASASTGIYLESLGDRLMNRLAWRMIGSVPHLVTAQTVDVNPSGVDREGIRYYNIVNPGSTPTIDQQGTISNLNYSLFMPSIAMDSGGNMGVTYSRSSASSHPSLWFVVVSSNNVIGTRVQIIAGAADNESCNNWGDYVSTAIDPSDDLSWWAVGEYFNTAQTGACSSSGRATFQTRIFTCKKGTGC